MCTIQKGQEKTYYAHKKEAKARINEIYHQHNGVDGYRRMAVYLARKGAKIIFKDVVVQALHCRSSIKYIPLKDYKSYTAQLRKVYGAPSQK